MKIVAIHQPNYFPWMGYFYKIARADCFIFLDDVEYSKGSFINRNRIKTDSGALWLTVPVKAGSTKRISEVKFANDIWRKKHVKTVKSAYGRAPFFDSIFPWLENMLLNCLCENLAELNIGIIKQICEKLRIGSNFGESSGLGIEGKGDDRLITIVKTVSGTCYLSGYGGSKYQDPKKFRDENLQFEYYSFQPPTYPQIWGEFIPNLSIIDPIFNIGIEGTRSLLVS